MFDPKKHHRRSIRLRNFDYSKIGAYFVTICCQKKHSLFEKYPELKTIVEAEWLLIPQRYSNIILDEFVVMPNHIHGIIVIDIANNDVGAGLASARREEGHPQGMPLQKDEKQYEKNAAEFSQAPAIGDIIGSYKSICSTRWLQYINVHNMKAAGKFWQRNYYEHIIRNEDEMGNIRSYIINNPMHWETDDENPKKK